MGHRFYALILALGFYGLALVMFRASRNGTAQDPEMAAYAGIALTAIAVTIMFAVLVIECFCFSRELREIRRKTARRARTNYQ